MPHFIQRLSQYVTDPVMVLLLYLIVLVLGTVFIDILSTLIG